MDIDFLGVGWASPTALENGQIQIAKYEERVRQSILTILSTAKGERVMRPNFGCDIHDEYLLPIAQVHLGRSLVMSAML